MADYLKIPELARRLDVSEPTARRMVKGGKLPSVFVGGAYRVSEEDLAAYLEDAKVRIGDPSPKVVAPPSLEWALVAPDEEYESWVEAAGSADLHKLFISSTRYAEGIKTEERRLYVLGRAQRAIDQFFRLQGINTAKTIDDWPSKSAETEGRETA